MKPSAACRGKIALCEKHAFERWDYKCTVMASPSREAADLGSAVYAVLVSVAAACECSASSHECHRPDAQRLVLAAAQHVLLSENIYRMTNTEEISMMSCIMPLSLKSDIRKAEWGRQVLYADIESHKTA